MARAAAIKTQNQNDLLQSQAFIDGAWRDAKSGKTFAVTDPATQNEIIRIADCGADDAREAIAAAHAAFPAWKNLLPKERAKFLKAWQQQILDHAEDLARLLTQEQGKPLAESRAEIASGAAGIEWSAEEARRIYGETIPPFKTGTRVITTREPVGVVGAITPWNFPHSMITRKVGPALAAGCTIVLKPAEDTPLSALALAALARAAGLPKGVFNVLPSNQPEAIGQVLTSDERVRKISFTGSTEVGRKLMEQSAPTLKKVSLELGGNAPFIIFDDADLEAALAGTMASKFRNAGQTCICANRVFIQHNAYSKFLNLIEKEVQKLKLGSGLTEGVTTGPLINQEALAKVSDLVEDACAKGAELLCGGKPGPQGGTFYQPTILANATPIMRLAKEEIFGPVIALFPFETEEEVIRLANATEYGLAAYFYTKDLGRAFRVAGALEYGMVAVNEAFLASEAIPFGGVKQSGFGREGGPHALEEYCVTKYTLLGGV
jgi:succinate-semialdehyde dehydrogenase/glutarate-semialdehyde dehydrogenase